MKGAPVNATLSVGWTAQPETAAPPRARPDTLRGPTCGERG